ncbi:SemiSWEET family sugar transporter [Planobispora rosea]|uniref:SemiSWEET family sugar transporter n=1 Tax=Planobispora rosea TaxID=35762 RepID=UPI00083A67B9|nr:SemiSWEET family transporter [Planobispora rosea]
MVTAVGLLAGVLTTACWWPQLHRSWRTRSTDDLSWSYLVMLALGVGLWVVYGIAMGDPAVTIANTVTFAALAVLIGIKVRSVRGVKG